MMRSCYISILLLLTSAGTLWAQQELANPLIPAKARPRVYVGPVVGYNRALHSSGFQSVAGDVLCPDFTTGTDNGYYFGFSGEYLLGKPQDSKSSIIARIVYNYLPANYAVPGDTLPSLANGEVVNSITRHVAEIKYSLIDLELIYKLNLFNSSFGVVVGPTIGYVIASSREQRMELISPDNATFDRANSQTPDGEYINGDRAIITARDNIEDKSSIRLAVKAGLQYELTAGRVLLVPCVYYNFGITEVSPSANLRVNALQAGIDIRFAL